MSIYSPIFIVIGLIVGAGPLYVAYKSFTSRQSREDRKKAWEILRKKLGK